MLNTTWVVVADGCRARFFSADRSAGTLSEIETLGNPQARLHEADLVRDRGGRDRNGFGYSHGLDTGSRVRQRSRDRFAGEVCQRLEKAHRRRAFGRLYVVGAPAFLGLMRRHQSPGLRRTIIDEIAKDITTKRPERIRALLPTRL